MLPDANAPPTITGSIAWMDGRFVESRRATLNAMTHGLHYATAVFEGIRSYGGRAFALRAHTERLRRSASLIGFDLPYAAGALDDAIEELIAANGEPETYIRPIAWRGSSALGVSGRQAGVHVAIATWPWERPVGSSGRPGLGLDVSRWRRPRPDQAPVQAKASGNYLIGAMARQEAEQRGYDDALMLDADSMIAEVTGANIFLVREQGEILVTPPAVSCLNGITRQSVIGIAERLGLTLEVRPVGLSELSCADEIFVCGTAYEVQPVIAIGGIRSLQPGPVTARIRAAYADAVRFAPGVDDSRYTLFFRGA
jgi:branched-chain amino acid aminotransferase